MGWLDQTDNIEKGAIGAGNMPTTTGSGANVQTFIPGMGMLGPDLGGAVKGDMLKREQGRLDAKEVREEKSLVLQEREQGNKDDYLKIAQDTLGISKEDLKMRQDDHAMKRTEFGWKEREDKRAVDIRDGMLHAAQSGGYEGAIDFLKVTDPEKAIQFTADKLKLDAGITQNSILKTKDETSKKEALFATYGLLGKMDTAILKAPAELQAQMYQQSMPMRLKLNPAAPTEWGDEAKGNALLASYQATPANILFDASKQYGAGVGELDKLNVQMGQLNKQGLTAENSSRVRDLQLSIDGIRGKINASAMQSQRAEIKTAKDKQSMETAVFNNTEKYNQNINKANPEYNTFMKNYSVAKPNLDILREEGTSTPRAKYAANGLARQYAKMYNTGQLSDTDVQVGFIARGWGDLWKKLQSQAGGEAITLNDTEIKGLTDAWQSIEDYHIKQQTGIETTWKKQQSSYGDSINHNAVRYPSDRYYQMQPEVASLQKDAGGALSGATPQQASTTQMVTIRNKNTGETKQVPADQAQSFVGGGQ